jgi:hypothetical protein
MSHHLEFAVLGKNSINSNWDGSPTTLQPNDNVLLPQTTNGSMVLLSQDTATTNNNGSLTYTSGGSVPQTINLYALQNQPNVLVNNWGGNNLSLTNTSLPSSATPVWVAAVGPGLPGVTPAKLPMDGTLITLTDGAVAQGNATPSYMQLIVQSTAGTLGIAVVIGGPPDSSGNNAYVIAVNAASNTGPGGSTPPAGYYATTTANTYTMQFNWGSSAVFVANESPSTAGSLSVGVRKL